jgi:hypothetical protein
VVPIVAVALPHDAVELVFDVDADKTELARLAVVVEAHPGDATAPSRSDESDRRHR